MLGSTTWTPASHLVGLAELVEGELEGRVDGVGRLGPGRQRDRGRVAGGDRQDLVHVPPRVVVGEDRLGDVAAVVAQRLAEIGGGTGDGVGRVVGTGPAVAVAVDREAPEGVAGGARAGGGCVDLS